MPLDQYATVGDLARAGALGRAVKKAWLNWSEAEIVNDVRDKWPGLADWKYEALVKLAEQGVAAARLLSALGKDQRMNQSDIPVIPP